MKIATDSCDAPGSAVDNGACNTGPATTVGACSSVTRNARGTLDGAPPGALAFQKGPVVWRRRLCSYLLFIGATSGALPFQKGPVLRRCQFPLDEVGGSFLQTTAGATMRKLSVTV